MIYIKKTSEPKSLVEHRCTPGADFDGLDKTELREHLLKEQGYLCAYCMKRIHDEKDTKRLAQPFVYKGLSLFMCVRRSRRTGLSKIIEEEC